MDITTLAILLGGIQQIEEKIKTAEKEGFKVQVEENKDILSGVGEEKIFYFIPKDIQAPENGYDEYIYANNKWELIGGTDVDLNYELLNNKPQINNITLSGNKSSDDLGLQKKLTAGQNIMIENDGTISASGGVTSYNNLTDKPQINGVALLGNKTVKELGLQDKNITIGGSPPSDSSTEYPYNYFWLDTTNYSLYTLIYIDSTQAPREYFYRWQRLTYQSIVSTENPPERSGNNVDKRYFPGDVWVQINANNTQVIDTFICVAWQQVTIDYLTWYYKYTWLKINATIQSAVVNNNGTITFTMSDGSTVTTTGQSVIGPQGDDYVLTAQDKADIADIVLQSLPTTQGTLYGKENN